jgi:hypothetical protein
MREAVRSERIVVAEGEVAMECSFGGGPVSGMAIQRTHASIRRRRAVVSTVGGWAFL